MEKLKYLSCAARNTPVAAVEKTYILRVYWLNISF